MSSVQPQNSTQLTHSPARKNNPILLLVDDEAGQRERYRFVIRSTEELDYLELLEAGDIDQALEILAGTPVHAVLLDKNIELGPDRPTENGIEAIPDFLRLQPHLQVLVLTGSKDISDVVRAMKLGAANYIVKETPSALLCSQIDRAVHVASLKLEKERRERTEISSSIQLGGKSPVFVKTLKQGESLAPSNRPVLILGETGTGKTELAQWIHHQRSVFLKTKNAPFISINISSLAGDLLESELFGHEKGAFTDASQMKRGLFEVANNGTLFLDEIGDLPLKLQPILLTAIETGVFKRSGGIELLRSNAKLIFATNRDLEKMVAEGTFREDLYMRISLFPIQMPSLSERKEDIPEIIRVMLPRACEQNRVPKIEFDDLPKDLIEYLIHTPFQGNVRGIQHQLERLLVHAPTDANGEKVFSRWKEIPGLILNSRSRKISSHKEHSLESPLSYKEFMARPWDLLSENFPGFNHAVDEFKRGLLKEASLKFQNRKDMAQAFGMKENNFSMLTKRHPELDGKMKKRGRGSPKSNGSNHSVSCKKEPSHESHKPGCNTH